jgi:hypothetical protein
VELDRSEHPKETVLAWPADWQRLNFSQSMPRSATICVPLDHGSSEITRSIFQNGMKAQSPRDLELQGAGGDLWRVSGVRFALPTEIATEDSRVRGFSSRPCLP